MSGIGQSTRGSLMGRSRDSAYGLPHHERFLPEENRESPRISRNSSRDKGFKEDVEENAVVAFFKDFRSAAITIRNLKLTGVLVLLITCGTVESITYSVNGQRYMALYLTSLNILVVMGATIFFGTIVGVKMFMDKEYWEDEATWTWRTHAGWFTRNIVLIAMCDTISLYMGILASHNVTAPLRTLLQQGSIPVTMFASWAFLRSSYKIVHMVGAIVIIIGILLAVMQILTEKGNPGQNSRRIETSDPTWVVLFFLSCFFTASSSCMKEYILTHETKRAEMNQVNAWVAFCQLILGLAISPLSYFAANKDSGSHLPPISEFPSNLADGLKCGVWGDDIACNAQCYYVNGGNISHYPPHPACGLDLAPLSVWLYVGVCCCFNLLMLYVIKESTAALFWISSAAIIPVVSIISTTSIYQWLDLGVVKFSVMQICGLVLVVLGIAVYRSQPEERPEEFMYDEEEPFEDAKASIYRSMVEEVAGAGSPSSTASAADTDPPLGSLGRAWPAQHSQSLSPRSISQEADAVLLPAPDGTGLLS